MKRIKIIIISLLVLALNLTLINYSNARRYRGSRRHRRHHRGRHMMPPHHMLYYHLDDEEFLSETGITRAKADEIKNLIRIAKKLRIPIIAKLRVTRMDFEEQVHAEKLNRKRIFILAKRFHDIIWELRKIDLDTRIKIAKLLTNTQRSKIEQFLRKRFRRRWRIGRAHRRNRRP